TFCTRKASSDTQRWRTDLEEATARRASASDCCIVGLAGECGAHCVRNLRRIRHCIRLRIGLHGRYQPEPWSRGNSVFPGRRRVENGRLPGHLGLRFRLGSRIRRRDLEFPDTSHERRHGDPRRRRVDLQWIRHRLRGRRYHGVEKSRPDRVWGRRPVRRIVPWLQHLVRRLLRVNRHGHSYDIAAEGPACSAGAGDPHAARRRACRIGVRRAPSTQRLAPAVPQPDEEETRSRVSSFLFPAFRHYSEAGNSIVKQVPLPTLLETSRSPPALRTMCLAWYAPIPIPSSPFVLSNGRNNRSRTNSTSMPHPVSAIVTMTWPFALPTRSVTRPSGGVASCALRTR